MEDGEFLNGSADGDDELSLVFEATTTTVDEKQQQGIKRARDEVEDELVIEYDIAEAISRNEAEAVETAATPSDAKRAKITPVEEVRPASSPTCRPKLTSPLRSTTSRLARPMWKACSNCRPRSCSRSLCISVLLVHATVLLLDCSSWTVD
jgi:hypothetical protein